MPPLCRKGCVLMEEIMWVWTGALLIVSALLDWKYRAIPLALPMLLLGTGLLLRLWEGSFPGCLWGLLPGALLFVLSLSGWLQIGPGDGLMLLALGIWETAAAIVLHFLAALVLAGLWGLLRYAWKKRNLKKEYPFLPFLCCSYLGRFLWL